MDERTVKFIIFMAFAMACFAVGYLARRRRWLHERHSRTLHLHSLIWFWAPVSLLSFWGLTLNRQVLLVMAAQPLLMVAAWLYIAPAARRLGCDRNQVGVLSLGAALSNHGFTLGAYLCYTLLSPADEALRLGIAYVTSMQVFMVLIFYPVARHYGPEDAQSLPRLMIDSLVTVRAMTLYASIAGVALNMADVPYPAEWIARWRVMDILFFAGAAGAYGGVGLRLHMGDSLRHVKLHGLLASAQFIVHPVATVALIALFAAVGLTIDPLPRDMMMIQAFTPSALNLVIVSNLFHLDARLASVLWLWNTLIFCVVCLPLLIWWWG